MKPLPIHRLPAPLEAAIQRLKLTAREACERTIESLGLAALAATSVFQRDGLLAAQFELNRKSAVFALHFNDALDERVLRELGPRGDAEPLKALASQPTSWDALSLVEDKEVEAQITADRFAMEIAGACEWELRELDAYVATVLAEVAEGRPDAGGEREREREREPNPLRPELFGHALIRAVDAVSDRADTRKQLLAELSRSLSALLPMAYAAMVAEFRNAGVRPIGLQLRHRGAGAAGAPGMPGAPGTPGAEAGEADPASMAAALASRSGAGFPYGGRGPGRQGFGPSSRGGSGFGSTRGGTPIGQVDPALMALLRRLSHADSMRSGVSDFAGGGLSGVGGGTDFDFAAPLPNLIHLHRDELRQASRGTLDHMVIDVIGFLFDQILADPKLPPQMARLIARMQLPVLRAALGDPSFFSSRKHPVRRFVNRIASLGAGFEDFSEATAREFLAKVKALVNEVVDGDFDQIEVYEQKLKALETFVAEQVGSGDNAEAARILAEKEDELRLRRLYAERLSGELRDLSGPVFVRDFIARTWSLVLLRASAGQPPEGGPDGALVQKFRRTARELAMSVQAKSTPAHKKLFLGELPKMMLELTEGMNLIGWPKSERDAFFAQLMPAHAAALKAPAAMPLDLNLMARRVETALESQAPSREELRALPATLPVLDDAVELPVLSAEEAVRVGLLDESAVDWNGQVDIDLGVAADPAEVAAAQGGSAQPAAPGLPAITDEAEPTQGRELADAVEVGFAYQMQLHDRWEKVRLSHVSAGRAFYLFTHGARQRQSVSLTHRMLQKLCEGGRFRAFEQASLIERATERARRQLASLSPQAR